jgi:tetratricopeptide (TPR) repeat protein
MVGLSKIMHASFYLRKKAYISAMQNGLDGLDILNEAQRIDSTNTEVLMFLGMYDFARAELKNRLWWVLFWYPGDQKTGIERLRRCSIQSTLMRTAAKLSLSEIYIKEGHLKSADSLLVELETRYPHSRFVLWSRVKFYEAQSKYSEAAKTYTQLSDSYQKTTEGRYNHLVSRYKAAQMFRNSGEITAAISLCQSLLNEPDLRTYKDLFKDTRRLLERVQNAESKS